MLGVHATPKPVELCADAILDVTNRGDTVLDALARDDFGVFAMCAFQNLNDEPYSTTGTFRRLRIN